MVSKLNCKGYVRVRVVGVAVAVAVFKSRPACCCISTYCFAAGFAVQFMVSAGNACAVCMVGNYNNQGVIAVFGSKFLGYANSLVKLNVVVSGTLPVHNVQLFINAGTFNHQEEAVFIFA